MAAKLVSSSFSCVVPPSSSSPFQSRKSSQWELSRTKRNLQQFSTLQLGNDQGVLKFHYLPHRAQKSKSWFAKKRRTLFASSEDQLQPIEPSPDIAKEGSQELNLEDASQVSGSSFHSERTDGRPGFVSFYNHRSKSQPQENIDTGVQSNSGSPLWFIGPAVLVASFIFPSLYMRRIISAVFEDSLLTDFLILFFTEALFYCGMAAFLLLIDRLRRPLVQYSAAKENKTEPSQFGQRISSGATLVLSLTIPMVTMGLVWPWTGPAASATLAPYLVGITVQFAFEQFARYRKSPALPVIPIVFQVYRLHQLSRAAQLVTALSFTVKGAEATAHNLAINKSLGTLLIVLQVLGVICIWSLSSFLMKFSPSASEITP